MGDRRRTNGPRRRGQMRGRPMVTPDSFTGHPQRQMRGATSGSTSNMRSVDDFEPKQNENLSDFCAKLESKLTQFEAKIEKTSFKNDEWLVKLEQTVMDKMVDKLVDKLGNHLVERVERKLELVVEEASGAVKGRMSAKLLQKKLQELSAESTNTFEKLIDGLADNLQNRPLNGHSQRAFQELTEAVKRLEINIGVLEDGVKDRQDRGMKDMTESFQEFKQLFSELGHEVNNRQDRGMGDMTKSFQELKQSFCHLGHEVRGRQVKDTTDLTKSFQELKQLFGRLGHEVNNRQDRGMADVTESFRELKQLFSQLGDDLNRGHGEEKRKTLDQLNELFLKGEGQLKDLDIVKGYLFEALQKMSVVHENEGKAFNDVKGLLTNQENMIKSVAERQEELLTKVSEFQSEGKSIVKHTSDVLKQSETIIHQLGNTETSMINMVTTLSDLSEQQNEQGQTLTQTIGLSQDIQNNASTIFKVLLFMLNGQMEITEKEKSVLSTLEGIQTSHDEQVKEMTTLQQRQLSSINTLEVVLKDGQRMFPLADQAVTEKISLLQQQVDDFSTKSQTLLSSIDETLTQQKAILGESSSLHTTDKLCVENIKMCLQKLDSLKDLEQIHLKKIANVNDQAAQGFGNIIYLNEQQMDLVGNLSMLYNGEQESLQLMTTIQTSSEMAVNSLQRIESASTENLILGKELREKEVTALQILSALQAQEMDVLNKVTDEMKGKETFYHNLLDETKTRFGVILREVERNELKRQENHAEVKWTVIELRNELSQIVHNAATSLEGNTIQIREMFGKLDLTTVPENLSVLTEDQTELHQSLPIRDTSR